ncbi:hypothetical protein [Parabacteroides goldsteinii]|uniref:hypothetical protein n=1 Tax=Parabacteroides goldsteinii TaxID=328812 RepID=UPI001D6CF383|nr:hypothetical protein [Parabacteroides goldsteinii]MBS6574711.1 hypothetical protein [Parabacteroides goldsteinii]
MEIFEYKVDLHINTWQRVSVLVHAADKEEANQKITSLAKGHPLSLDNGNEDIEIDHLEYLHDTESLIESTMEAPTVEVYDAEVERFEAKNALYTNKK